MQMRILINVLLFAGIGLILAGFFEFIPLWWIGVGLVPFSAGYWLLWRVEL